MKYDIVTKTIIKEIAYDISKYIIGIDVDENLTLLEQEFDVVEKRESDILFKSADNIIHIEMQNSNNKNMPIRMLRYYSDILLKYKEYNIFQYVIYTGKSRCNVEDKIVRDKCDFNYTLIDMAKMDCEEFLNSDNPASVALSILCDFNGRDSKKMVKAIVQKLIYLTKNDSYKEDRYFKMLEILSTNRDLEKIVKEEEKIYKVDIERLPSFMIGEEKGIEKGAYTQNIKVAKALLSKNSDIAFIVDVTGLSIVDVQKLQSSEEVK